VYSSDTQSLSRDHFHQQVFWPPWLVYTIAPRAHLVSWLHLAIREAKDWSRILDLNIARVLQRRPGEEIGLAEKPLRPSTFVNPV
jgi:hypothetical protein